MTAYRVRVQFNDGTMPQLIDLPGASKDAADKFATTLWLDIGQAKDVGKEMIQAPRADTPGPDVLVHTAHVESVTTEPADTEDSTPDQQTNSGGEAAHDRSQPSMKWPRNPS